MNNNGYDINQTVEGLFALKNAGRNPQQIMQLLMQRTPQFNEIMARLQNMAQGRNPREFLLQLARQNGINEKNIEAISQMFPS